jgi:hypothetical protein
MAANTKSLINKQTIKKNNIMKKIILSLFAVTLLTASYAQSSGASLEKASANLNNNMKTAEDLQNMLMKDYTQIMDVRQGVPGKNFKMGTSMTLSGYGDENAIKEAKKLEETFNKTFEGSLWSFSSVNENSQPVLTVKAGGKTESGTYSAFPGSAAIEISSFLMGKDLSVFIFQNKKDKNNHLITFAVQNGLSMVSEFNLSNEKASASTGGPKTMNAAAAVAPAVAVPNAGGSASGAANQVTNEAKNKAKNAVKGKLGKLL